MRLRAIEIAIYSSSVDSVPHIVLALQLLNCFISPSLHPPGWIITGMFVTVTLMGHFYLGILVFFVETVIFREIISLKQNEDKDLKVRRGSSK